MYITRYLEKEIRRINRAFRVLYLGGPRQAGKTTLLRHLAGSSKRRYVTLDHPSLREQARSDPALFLEHHPPPVLIDEAQYAPALFPYIKMRVDEGQARGQYWLTGSQQWSLMKDLQESLAGRVGLATLLPLSLAELRGVPRAAEPFLPGRKGNPSPRMTAREIFEVILSGAFPELHGRPDIDRETFYESYVQTYIDRDIREIFGVEKLSAFHRFLELCAARTGQLLNYSDLARDTGVSVPTATEWINILETTMQIFLLRPWHRSRSKRITKSPKLYLLDTGLAAHLGKWPTAETLMKSAAAGPFFETFVISEIVKSYLCRGKRPPCHFFRDREKHEVDLLIEHEGGEVYPVEIKLRSSVRPEDGRGMAYLRGRVPNVGRGAIVCLTDESCALDRETDVLSVSAIR